MRPTPVDPSHERLARPEGLAERMRRMRERAGLSGKALAAAAGWQPSKVSRLENARQRPTVTDVEAWSRACGADQTTTQGLLALLDDVESFHRDWKQRMRLGQAPVQADYNQLVAKATLIRHFETVYIPGLLQTPEYARRALGEMVDLHGLAVADVDDAIAARLRRQQLLYDEHKSFEFLLAESVLHWLLCPPQAMAAQLDRLQTVVGLPNIRFGIIPFGVQLPVTPQNAFQLYDDIAIVETFIGETVHRGADAGAYAQAMDRLWAQAITGDDARHLIIRAAHPND
jgi:transcriptional regulator with XRE-family HTH domain